jgi:hypothetical protein
MPVIVDLLDDWSTPDVKPKYIDSSFKKLSTITPDSFIEWYTHLYAKIFVGTTLASSHLTAFLLNGRMLVYALRVSVQSGI